MCGSKKSTDVDTQSSSSRTPRSSKSFVNLTDGDSSYNYTSNSAFSKSSISSLSSFKDSLPETPFIYDFHEICSATANFLSKPFSSSSAWRCSLRGKDVILFRRKLRRPLDLPGLRHCLSLVCRSHHSTLIKLIGASVSGNLIYLAYEFVSGATLRDCLRNPKNPNFTVLSSWVSRMQIATDLAHGLDYIHHCSGLNSSFVHNHIKSSSIIVTDELSARICHFGTAELCGEVAESDQSVKRTGSGAMKLEGTRGYMAPEFQVSQKTDVYAFGVVILELVSGQEALKYTFDEESGGGYRRVSVIEAAREAVEGGAGEVRRWVDKRMRDSYPVEAAAKMARLGLDCVDQDPGKRPDMGRVTGAVSKLYLESKDWAEKMGAITDFSVSMAPR